MTFYHFAMRTDKCFDLVKAYVESIADTTGFAVREVSGENEHWHWYLRCPRKIQSFRVNLCKKVPDLRGNGAYSVKECTDPDGYWRYMCKGEAPEVDPEMAWAHGLDWTAEKMEELHNGYWLENARRKKRKVGSVQDHVIDECRRTAVAWDDRRAITILFIRELVARSRPINTYAVKSAVRVIGCLLCGSDEAIELVANDCLV